MEFTQLENIKKKIKEYRHYYRYDTDLPAMFKKREVTAFTSVKIINISVVGGYLQSKTPLQSGDEIELNFRLPGASKKPITCQAKIIWSANFEGYQVGIKFINIKRIDQYRIAVFIANALKKNPSHPSLR